MPRFIIILILLSLIIGGLGFVFSNIHAQFYGVPKEAPVGNYTITVEQGDNLAMVANQLQKDKVINNAGAFLFLEGLNPIQPLQTGVYRLELNGQNPEDLLDLIDQETTRLEELVTSNTKPSVSITFKEGLQLDEMINLLETNEVSSKEELQNYLKNPSNFNREKYPFLVEPLNCEYGDITKCAEYYPEGYLYPDTYEFFVPSTPEQIFNKFLDNFNRRVWKVLEPQPSPADLHKALIMASVLERETGRPLTGVNQSNIEEVNEERRKVARAFYNRLEQGIKWQSDTTAEYGTGRKLCQQTFEIENCLLLDSPLSDHLYNTYRIDGYPIGPITSPRIENIQAVLNPAEGNFIFFVSDITGKTYFADTLSGHEANIVKAQEINKSLEKR